MERWDRVAWRLPEVLQQKDFLPQSPVGLSPPSGVPWGLGFCPSLDCSTMFPVVKSRNPSLVGVMPFHMTYRGEVQPDDDLYEAERVVHIRRFPSRFADGKAAQAYLEHVIGTRWFQDRWPKVAKRPPRVVESRHAHAWAEPAKRIIYLPAWALSDFVLLHELAHMCSPKLDHDEPFRSTHHLLIRHFMGVEAAKCYRHACRAFALG